MFAKKLLNKATHHHHHQHHQREDQHGNPRQDDFDIQILSHLGIPITGSILDVDPLQQLLAIGTLDGRIKVLGGDSIEGLLISPKQLPYKNLKFLQNKGYLVGIVNDNDIQVWNLESRSLSCSLQWESNITAFSVISGSLFMILGDEFGEVSILKYAPEGGKLVQMPYRISPHIIAEKTGIIIPTDQPVAGVLPQPSYFGDRILIAYQYGLIILWDVITAEVVVFKGDKDLLIKGHLSDSSRKLDVDPLNNALEDMYEKEISALCWASSIGSILAVGYIDGDILLWDLRAPFKCNKTGDSFNDVVKLQLSSAEKRLPVIILHWSEVNVSQNSSSGQLFVYGGCEIGSEEAITVVSMKWSPGMETLKSVSRVDLAVHSAFADMVFLSSLGTPAKGQYDGLFVLTRPGELQFYDMKFLSSLASQHERKSHASGVKFHVAIPTTDPQMTATKLSSHAYDGNVSAWLLEITSFGSTLSPGKCTKWPLTGGTWNEGSSADEKPEKRIYIAGYKDGTVRVWDVTKSTFSLVSYLEGQVPGIENVGLNISVTSLDFCESTMNLAVGSECGAVRVYSLTSGGGTKLHWVKHSEQKVYDMPSSKGPHCKAVFSLVNARVQSLQFSLSGIKLAVGFESSHVAVLDMRSLSVLFFTDSVASSTSPIISAILKTFSDVYEFSEGSKHLGSKHTEQPSGELVFTVTQDSKVNVLDSRTGSTITTRPLHLKKEHKAISIYVLEESEFSSKSPNTSESRGTEHFCNGEKLMDSLLLLCCEDVLRLYQMRSVIQGDDKPVCKVNLAKSCCWTSILRKDDKIGLILVYQSGTVEIRLLPSLELLLESSINSALRWNFRSNMENLTSSTDQGLISLVNGGEVVFFSLSTGENETIFRESLPLLHDKVMSTAADAAISYSIKHKKQVAASGILGGIVKGLKKESKNTNDPPSLTNFLQLERIFSHPVVTDSSLTTLEYKEEEVEELDIDDIEIDEPILPAATSSNQAKGKATGKLKDSLFEGKHMDMKPKTRTPEEIMAAYRGAEYASAAAERAKNKLLERQEKLERIGQRTEDLRNEAEDFASMAHELAKTMESRKRWWKI
ncbi:lethal(2) giant larvae protein homolog SRO77-like [Silene latifolia]|uniref:lethal(2) giant larvae protein homolog SRO77-like n=1 Tax=Silene latifolia TaxID=37657 RepID=UPI003D787D78